MPLPERVNAMRVVTYDVSEIYQSLTQHGMEFTDEEVMHYIFDMISIDFDGIDGVTIQDEEGNEL